MTGAVKNDFGPEYLRAEDLIRDGEWAEFTLEIEFVAEAGTIKAADGTLIEHPVIAFAGAKKRFVCGKLNKRLMKFATGCSKPIEWIGKTITIRAHAGDWFGQKQVAAIRLVIPQDKPKPFLKKKDMGVPLRGPVIQP